MNSTAGQEDQACAHAFNQSPACVAQAGVNAKNTNRLFSHAPVSQMRLFYAKIRTLSL
jgi:hypothetical protein